MILENLVSALTTDMGVSEGAAYKAQPRTDPRDGQPVGGLLVGAVDPVPSSIAGETSMRPICRNGAGPMVFSKDGPPLPYSATVRGAAPSPRYGRL